MTLKKNSMKTILHSYRLAVLAFAMVFIAACSSDSDNDNPSTPPDPTPPVAGTNLVELAQETADLSSLVAALEAAGGNLITTLSGTGPFTIFAPSNTAFETFLDGRALTDIPAGELQQLLLNHVISGENRSTNLNTGYVSTLSTAGVAGNNLSLLIDLSSGVSLNGISTVETPDMDASNGVIHIVDAVITLPTITTHIMGNPNLAELENSMGAEVTPEADFLEILAGDGPYTLFAPSNAASNNFNNPDGNNISNVIFNHILLNNATLTNDFVTSYDLTTAATNENGDNLSLFVNTSDGIVLNGVSTGNLDNKDIIGTNGIIHIVETVIDLPTLITFGEADPNLSPLIDALDAASSGIDFNAVLSQAGPFTVFAPLDTAFDTLLSDLGVQSVNDIDSATLGGILFHHVIEGNIRAEDLTDGIAPVTLQGDAITINLPGTGDNIANITDGSGNSGVGVLTVNIQANNGVIHVIDSVLLPSN